MDINRINTLIESASLLTEDVTSVIKSRTKKITKDAKELAKLFIAGKLEPTEAKKLYEETMREINIIKKDINETKLTTNLIDRLHNICTGKVASQIATEAALTAGAYVLGTLIKDKLPDLLTKIKIIKQTPTIPKSGKKGNKDVAITDVVGDSLRVASVASGSATVHTTTKAFSEADVAKQLREMITDAEKELKYTYDKAYMPQLTESISDILLEAVEILLEEEGSGSGSGSTGTDGNPGQSGGQNAQSVIAAVKSNASAIANIINAIQEVIKSSIIELKQIVKFKAIPDATVINDIKYNNQIGNARRDIANYINSVKRGDKADAGQRVEAIDGYFKNNSPATSKTIAEIKGYARDIALTLSVIQKGINMLHGDANAYDESVFENLNKWSGNLSKLANDIDGKCKDAAKSIK